jgi:hypothetical protein
MYLNAGIAFPFFGHMSPGEGFLLAAGGLLAIAACLLLIRRRQVIALQRCWVTDELLLQLSRIADALERQAARPIQPVVAQVSKQAEDPPREKLPEEAHTIPYSMFGREMPRHG